MNSENLIAKAQTTIAAPVDKVWDALINPVTIKKYMFGTTVTSDWKEGSKITWKGEWKGNPYEDYGKILQIKPKSILRYTHFSPMMGKPDSPENYHTVTIDLEEAGNRTHVSLMQDHNETEETRNNSEQNWKMMLEGMKKLLEN